MIMETIEEASYSTSTGKTPNLEASLCHLNRNKKRKGLHQSGHKLAMIVADNNPKTNLFTQRVHGRIRINCYIFLFDIYIYMKIDIDHVIYITQKTAFVNYFENCRLIN
ncbi:hypothetical protein ACOSQ4_015541 [Xanthoceras sorbifolium]